MEMSASFKREIGELADVFGLVESFFGGGGIDADKRFPIDLAVEEIFTNFVKYNPQGKGEISIRLSLEGDEIKLAMIDPDAEPFDITQESPEVNVDQPLEERTRGKLGIHLVKKMMDRVEYDHASGASTITLYKRVERGHVRD